MNQHMNKYDQNLLGTHELGLWWLDHVLLRLMVLGMFLVNLRYITPTPRS